MSNSEDSKYISFSWFAGILVAIIIAGVGAFFTLVMATQRDQIEAVRDVNLTQDNRLDQLERMQGASDAQTALLVRIAVKVGIPEKELEQYTNQIEQAKSK
jgi:hypothetical protein